MLENTHSLWNKKTERMFKGTLLKSSKLKWREHSWINGTYVDKTNALLAHWTFIVRFNLSNKRIYCCLLPITWSHFVKKKKNHKNLHFSTNKYLPQTKHHQKSKRNCLIKKKRYGQIEFVNKTSNDNGFKTISQKNTIQIKINKY